MNGSWESYQAFEHDEGKKVGIKYWILVFVVRKLSDLQRNEFILRQITLKQDAYNYLWVLTNKLKRPSQP